MYDHFKIFEEEINGINILRRGGLSKQNRTKKKLTKERIK